MPKWKEDNQSNRESPKQEQLKINRHIKQHQNYQNHQNRLSKQT